MKRELYAEMGPDGKYRVFINGKLISKSYDHDEVLKIFDEFQKPFMKHCEAFKRHCTDANHKCIGENHKCDKSQPSSPGLQEEFNELNDALDVIEGILGFMSEKNKDIEGKRSEYIRLMEENKKLKLERDKYKALAENAESRLDTYKRLEDIIKNVMKEKENE